MIKLAKWYAKRSQKYCCVEAKKVEFLNSSGVPEGQYKIRRKFHAAFPRPLFASNVNTPLSFKRHITLLNSKLKRANNLLALSRHYLTQKLLIQIYYGQFYSHLTYGCQLWGQNENAIEQTITLQKKAIRLISFAHFQEHASPLFKKLNLLKLTDIVRLNNIVFTHDTINAKTPPIFESYFIFNKTSHQHETVNSLNSIYSLPTGSLKLPAYRTESGKSSIRFICSSTWNTILKDISIKNINKYNKDHFWMNKTNIKTLKHILHKHFLEYY